MPYEPYLLIPLHRRDGTVRAHAIISHEDAHLAECRWCLHGQGYVHRGGPEGHVMLHRVILGLTPGDGLDGDHRNLDRLDNQRSNLRIATRAQNNQNRTAYRGSTSAYRGVGWHSTRGRWRACGVLQGVDVHLGLFDSEEEAAAVARAWRLANMSFTVEDRTYGSAGSLPA